MALFKVTGNTETDRFEHYHIVNRNYHDIYSKKNDDISFLYHDVVQDKSYYQVTEIIYPINEQEIIRFYDSNLYKNIEVEILDMNLLSAEFEWVENNHSQWASLKYQSNGDTFILVRERTNGSTFVNSFSNSKSLILSVREILQNNNHGNVVLTINYNGDSLYTNTFVKKLK